MPLTSARWRWWIKVRRGPARTRKARGAVKAMGDRGDGEEAARVRGGREARPFFDPKRGQLGANFLGGTGLTRPPGILAGAHTTVRCRATVSPRKPRATCWYYWSRCCLSPSRRRLETPARTINIERTPLRVWWTSSINSNRGPCRKQEERSTRAPRINDVWSVWYLRVVRKRTVN